MDVKDIIEKRRAFRALSSKPLAEDVAEDLVGLAGLAPSCFNKQPWRFIAVSDKKVLANLHRTLSSGNRWATRAPLVFAVVSRRDMDCVVKDREYFLFDTGMATAFLILRATELNLVAHPIAGFDAKATKEALGIPQDMILITLVFVGRHDVTEDELLSDGQKEAEKKRPPRLDLREILRENTF